MEHPNDPPRRFTASDAPDHLVLAKRTLDENPTKAQAHANIAVAETLARLTKAEEFVPASELRDGQELADGSVVFAVAEVYDVPEAIVVTISRGGKAYELRVLRTTPLALAKKP